MLKMEREDLPVGLGLDERVEEQVGHAEGLLVSPAGDVIDDHVAPVLARVVL